MLNASIAVENKPSHTAPAALLGQQIEACYAAVEGLLSDRLANPKFAWPADARTGIAHRWHTLAAAFPSWYSIMRSMRNPATRVCFKEIRRLKALGRRRDQKRLAQRRISPAALEKENSLLAAGAQSRILNWSQMIKGLRRYSPR